jgi:CheY-like chemotaxis protein
MADRAQLEQVLVNLAINARDAMPNGGRLTIETADVAVGPDCPERGSVPTGQYVMLAVSDTGVGIPGDVLPHIFEPFFTTKPDGHGTGLGLATCYGIVHQAGGRILVRTEPGKGTRFEILLPRVDGSVDAPERTSAARTKPGVETLLFVEDDAAVRRIGEYILRERGYRVLSAPDGPAALRLANEHAGPIHLLITDVVLPRMSGPELARRALEQRPGLRVLYTSGYAGDSVVQGSEEARSAFLPKPYVLDTLLSKVRTVLDR